MQFRATHFMSLQNALYSIPSVQRTLCHCERKNGGPRGILCTRGEKAHTSKRVSIIAPDNAISKVQCATHLPEGLPYKTHARYFCTCVEKKAQTSIRVSVIAPDNVISKAQFAPCSAILCQFICLIDTFCGKNKPDPCQRDTFRAFFNYSAIKLLFVSECLSYFRIVEKVVFVQVFFVKRLYVGLCSQPRLFERRFCP